MEQNYGLLGLGMVHVYDPGNEPAIYYTSINKFDFNVSTVFSDASWRWQNWQFTFGGDYRRLLDSGNYDEFYHEFVPRWSVGREFSLGKSSSLSVTYEGDYRFFHRNRAASGAESNVADLSRHFQRPHGSVLAPGQRVEERGVDPHEGGLVEGADEVLARGMVHAGLAAHARIHHSEQGRGCLHAGHAAQKRRRRKAATSPTTPPPSATITLDLSNRSARKASSTPLHVSMVLYRSPSGMQWTTQPSSRFHPSMSGL